MEARFHCNIEKEEYLDIASVEDGVIFEIINFYEDYPTDDERSIQFALVNLNRNQILELYNELGSYLGQTNKS